jgi:hypothetical protein
MSTINTAILQCIEAKWLLLARVLKLRHLLPAINSPIGRVQPHRTIQSYDRLLHIRFEPYSGSMAAIALCHSPCSRAPPSLRQHQRSKRQCRDRLIAAAFQQRRPAAGDQAPRRRGGSGSGSGGAQPLAPLLLAAVHALATLQLVLPLPSLADGGDFTIRSEPPAGDVEEDYFETVPQGLDSADSSTAPRLGSLIEGPKGKKVGLHTVVLACEHVRAWTGSAAGAWLAALPARQAQRMRCTSQAAPAELALPCLLLQTLVEQVQQCTRKCVPTCIRGGQGSPGLGPMTLR